MKNNFAKWIKHNIIFYNNRIFIIISQIRFFNICLIV